MKRLFPNVVHFSRLVISNVFLVDGGPGDRWLIDCGHWLERGALVREIKRTGLVPGDLTGILLTHRHSDHAGNARFFHERFGMKVFAHEDDAKILSGELPRPRMDPAGSRPDVRVMVAFENRWPSRVPIERTLRQGDSVGGLEVHWIPGHTEGSVFYKHEATNSLLTGDSLLTAIPPLVRRAGFSLAYPIFSTNLRLAHDSVLAFHRAAHAYENLLAGHGRPVLGNARARVDDYLARISIAPRTR